MAMLSAASSPFCQPEEDPFLLLESSLKAIERILQLRRGLPLRRSWIEQPYGEEEITLLEEEVIPVISSAWRGCMSWMASSRPSRMPRWRGCRQSAQPRSRWRWPEGHLGAAAPFRAGRWAVGSAQLTCFDGAHTTFSGNSSPLAYPSQSAYSDRSRPGAS